MDAKPDEQRLLLISGGVVVFSIIALILFIFQSWALFFIIAILGLIMGVYLAYSLSKTEKAPAPAATRKKR